MIPPKSIKDSMGSSRISSFEPALNTKHTEGQIADLIKRAAALFSAGRGKLLPGTGGLAFFQLEGKNFFGIHKDQQKDLDYKNVRLHICQLLEIPLDTEFLQVVGDSMRFSADGTEAAEVFLEDNLANTSSLIMWGYTGRKGELEGRLVKEVNEVVSDWLKHDPSRFKTALANVVDFHSPKAIQEWNCSIPTDNTNFYLVYGDAEFGMDVESSDKLTQKAICEEGGVQSFRQIVNFLDRDVPVNCLYNLRGKNNPDTFNPASGEYLNFFSAAEFLALLKTAISQKKGSFERQDVETFLHSYLEERCLYNRNKGDASTKQALFDKAWELFIGKELWKKLDLCRFKKTVL